MQPFHLQAAPLSIRPLRKLSCSCNSVGQRTASILRCVVTQMPKLRTWGSRQLAQQHSCAATCVSPQCGERPDRRRSFKRNGFQKNELPHMLCLEVMGDSLTKVQAGHWVTLNRPAGADNLARRQKIRRSVTKKANALGYLQLCATV